MDSDDIVVEPIRYNTGVTSLQLVRQLATLLGVANGHPPCTFTRSFLLMLASALEHELLSRGEYDLLLAWNDSLEWPMDELVRWDNQ